MRLWGESQADMNQRDAGAHAIAYAPAVLLDKGKST